MKLSNAIAAFVIAFAVAAPVTAQQPMSPQAPSLYKRLGGYDALAAVTDDFIGRLAGDPQLGKFFAGHSTHSLKKIRQLVVDQLCNDRWPLRLHRPRHEDLAHWGSPRRTDAGQASCRTLDKFTPAKEKDEVLTMVSTSATSSRSRSAMQIDWASFTRGPLWAAGS
jgi:hemoglobin